MRTMTVDEYILEKLNERLQARGENVRLVAERPRPEKHSRPRLVEDDNNVVSFAPKGGEPTMQF
jgi:hypothetical protein